jgi:MOSC domain-containing protein YiiM
MKKIVSVSVSAGKGSSKTPVGSAVLEAGLGIRGDAHAGSWHRQISLLASERIGEVQARGIKVGFGSYAENVATEGVDWKIIPVGTKVRLGPEAEVEITQIGKKCHSACEILRLVGDCVMPREGAFARVLTGGTISAGDRIEILAGE